MIELNLNTLTTTLNAKGLNISMKRLGEKRYTTQTLVKTEVPWAVFISAKADFRTRNTSRDKNSP